eukprot:COSAG02_NODE_6370_length_3619_cov_86.835227_2_plen_97_part_00
MGSVSTVNSNTSSGFGNIHSDSVGGSTDHGMAGSIGDQNKRQQDSFSSERVSLDGLHEKMSRKFREQRHLLRLHKRQGKSVLVHAAKVDNLGKKPD